MATGQSRRVALPPHTFFETRTGHGSPIVLIHGLGGSSDWWRRNIDRLAERHLVVAVDLVGFGRNRFFLRRSSLPLTFEEIAALLARWLESFGEPVHLVGNSMGGQVAIHVAATRPDLVRSLVLVDSSGIPFAVQPMKHLENLIMPRGAWSFLTILARDLFRAGPSSMAVALARLLRDDARPLLSRLSMPVLLLWGDHDPFVPLTYAQQMLTIIPNARLRVIPNAGHVPMWENPDAFNQNLLRFLEEVEGSDAARPRDRETPEPFAWALSGPTEGMVWRSTPGRADTVLLHGLGMSSAYFERFAHALFDRGLRPVAPDLPGFGDSAGGPPLGPADHAAKLARWADALGIRDALWIGHSAGCCDVVELAAMRPDLVRRAVCIGPLWSKRHPARLFFDLFVDVFRERPALFKYVWVAYRRCGVVRWTQTFRRYAPELRRPPELPSTLLIAGERDPLVDRTQLPGLRVVPGAHACHFSFANETAAAVVREL